MQRLGYPQSISDAERRLLTSLADVLAVDDPAASQKAYSESLNRYKEWRQKLTAMGANAYRKWSKGL